MKLKNNPELEALLKRGFPEGSSISVCGNCGKMVTIEGRIWWGYPILLEVNGVTKTRFGVNVIQKRVPYGKEDQKMKEAREILERDFPELISALK